MDEILLAAVYHFGLDSILDWDSLAQTLRPKRRFALVLFGLRHLDFGHFIPRLLGLLHFVLGHFGLKDSLDWLTLDSWTLWTDSNWSRTFWPFSVWSGTLWPQRRFGPTRFGFMDTLKGLTLAQHTLDGDLLDWDLWDRNTLAWDTLAQGTTDGLTLARLTLAWHTLAKGTTEGLTLARLTLDWAASAPAHSYFSIFYYILMSNHTGKIFGGFFLSHSRVMQDCLLQIKQTNNQKDACYSNLAVQNKLNFGIGAQKQESGK